MAEKYENLGPIYTTAAKYEAMRIAGTLESGREYKIVDWEPQEKLTQGNGINITNNTIKVADDLSIDNVFAEEEIEFTDSTGDFGTNAAARIDSRIDTKISGKQDTLVSGTNIKTINNTSILGNGNITVSGSFPEWTGVPFSSGGKPTLNNLGDGSFEFCFIGTSTGGTCLYDLGVLTVGSGSLAGIAPRGPMVKKKYLTTSSADVNEYFMSEYAGGLLKVWSINMSTGEETDATPTRISEETASTKIFYRKLS